VLLNDGCLGGGDGAVAEGGGGVGQLVEGGGGAYEPGGFCAGEVEQVGEQVGGVPRPAGVGFAVVELGDDGELAGGEGLFGAVQVGQGVQERVVVTGRRVGGQRRALQGTHVRSVSMVVGGCNLFLKFLVYCGYCGA
jgi:hypothetical protein